MAISSLYDRKDKLSTDFSTKFFTRQAVSITSSQIKDITTKQINYGITRCTLRRSHAHKI